MIDPGLATILISAFKYGVVGSLLFAFGRVLNRKKEGPKLDQAAAIGFLVGASFGAFIGIFQSMTDRL